MVDSAPAGPERRRHPRHELLAQVRVSRGRTDIVMEMVNISRSGALIDMGTLRQPAWVDVGRTLDIAVAHPVSFDLLELKGTVVRISKDDSGTCFAVDFVDISNEADKSLRELVMLAKESEAPPATAPPAGAGGGGPPPLPGG